MVIGPKLSVIVLHTNEVAVEPPQLSCTLQTLGHLGPTEAKMRTTRKITIQEAGKY